MSSVLARADLERSPLADLHLLANELAVDGFRRMRRDDLIDAILVKQSGVEAGADDAAVPAADVASSSSEIPGFSEEPDAPLVQATPSVVEDPAGAPATEDPDGDTDEAQAPDLVEAAAAEALPDADTDADTDAALADAAPALAAEPAEDEAEEDGGSRGRRGRRGGRGRGRARSADGTDGLDPDATEPAADAEDRMVEGVVELLANGSGFVRPVAGEASDADVYISAAQVKRCELVAGDVVAGPVRAPRRSERFPSLVRVDTINGRPADQVAEGTRFEDLPAAFPSERLALGAEDPTVKAVEWLTPFGKGSRVLLTGGARAGKSEALRRLAAPLAGREDLELTVVLAGVRPEEVGDWQGPLAPATSLSFAASPETQAQAVEQAMETARRVAARGGDAVVVVDSLEYLPPPAARRVLAAARNVVDGGSLTVLATAPAPLGGENTVIALDPALTALGRFPALDLSASGTLRAELLVGEAGAQAIAQARGEWTS